MADAQAALAKVLLVDDQPANLDLLRRVLETAGYQVLLAPSGAVALRNAARARPDLVLLDVMMPEMDGYEVCRRLKADAATQEVPVIFCAARDLGDDIVRGFELGAVDYIVKPFREQEVLKRVETHVRLHRLTLELRDKNEALKAEVARREKLDGHVSLLSERDRERWGIEAFVGQSATMRRIFDEIQLLQENPVITVLITGESGTGKELIARAIHRGGPRATGPFLAVNCAALPRELAESLLFGHVKGAFTGAAQDRAGSFEAAHGGTLFLDEIGEMAPEEQAKLLRVLEDGEVTRVGASRARRVDVRVLAATNVDLQERIATGAFRQDLYYRLARFTVTAPPLRERPDDIPLLAAHFARHFAAEMGREAPGFAAQALGALRAYAFPGNVRELKNVIERALLAAAGSGVIEVDHLRFDAAATAPTGVGGERSGADVAGDVGPAAQGADGSAAGAAGGGAGCARDATTDLPADLDAAVAELERCVVARALERTGGNVSAATRLLGTNRNRIYRILGSRDDG